MAKVTSFVGEPMPRDVRDAIERLATAPGVRRIAVMPDVHLASDVCVGTVLATDDVVYPQAVGGDIGCGMATLRLDVDADAIDDEQIADRLFAQLRERVPIVRRHRPLAAHTEEPEIAELGSRVARDAGVQFATVGRGNHFVELQADEQQRLWLAVHSGSRAVGPAVRAHHLRDAPASNGLVGLRGEAAAAYLRHHDVAVRHAAGNRRAIAAQALLAIEQVLGAAGDWSTWFDVTHNFVRREQHDGESLWVHRKGACAAGDGDRLIIPGSMGTATYHAAGRGHAPALRSSSHGAGRCLARGQAIKRISARRLARDLEGVFFERRLGDRLRDEAPSAYKDIGKVMRAQRDLVRIVRRLRPVLVYKGA